MDLAVDTGRAVVVIGAFTIRASRTGNQNHLLTIHGLGIGDGGQLGIRVGGHFSLNFSAPIAGRQVKVCVRQNIIITTIEEAQIAILQLYDSSFRAEGRATSEVIASEPGFAAVGGVDKSHLLAYSTAVVAVNRKHHNAAGGGNGIAGRDKKCLLSGSYLGLCADIQQIGFGPSCTTISRLR